jgi:outer membrane protein, heavy metal efflux system
VDRHSAGAATGVRWACVRASAAMLTLLPLLAAALPLLAAAPAPAQPMLGAELADLVAHVRRLSPELAAAALDAEAAAARVDAAGRLADPTLTVLSDQNRNRNGGLVPGRFGNWTVTVQQTFPLGGRRELQRQVAAADARQAASRQLSVQADLVRRVKTVFIELHQAGRLVQLSREIDATVGQLVRQSESRYAQGLGEQQDVLRAQFERHTLANVITRFDGERARLKLRLNALLNRPTATPLADPRALPAVPPLGRLQFAALLDRAQRSNPGLAMQAAEIDGADANRVLVRRSWYPDLTLGIGIVNNAATESVGRRVSYEAMASINIPLAWGLREAQAREANLRAGAARTRREAALIQLEAELGEALQQLRTLAAVAQRLGGRAVPETRLASRSALTGYATGRVDARTAIEVHHRLFEVQQELLRVEAERRARLADIEFLIGDEL